MGGKDFTDTINVVANKDAAETIAQVTLSEDGSYGGRNCHSATLPGYIVTGGTPGAIAGGLDPLTYYVARSDASLYNTLNGTISTSVTNFAGLNAYGLAAANASQTSAKDSSWNLDIFNTGAMTDESCADLAFGRYALTAQVFLPKTGSSGNNGKDRTASNTIAVYYYNGAAVDDLRDLVQDCFNANRKQIEYYDTEITGEITDELGNTTPLKVNGAQAWTDYISALNTAATRAYQQFNTSYEFDAVTPLEPLKTAIRNLEICRKSAEDLAAQGQENTDTGVLALKAILETQTIGSYKDYMMYRWDRYSRWVDSANNMIARMNNAKAAVETKYVPGARFKYSELTTKLASDAYAQYILALEKTYTAEELENLNKAKAAAETDYNRLSSIDVAEVNAVLAKMYQRLLPREGGDDASSKRGYVKYYLNAEIASAVAQLGEAASNAAYLQQSWDKYLAALANAKTAAASATSNGDIFDAQYELQKSRNELILVADAADYAEAEELVAATEAVLANLDLYTAGSSAAEIGAVLAAYGHETADGEQIFNDTVKGILTGAYKAEDQRRIDSACDKLRLALSNLKLQTSAVAPAPSAPEVVEEVVPVAGTAGYNAVIAPKQPLATIKNYLEANTSATEPEAVIVTETMTYAGTGAIVTIYGKVNISGIEIKVPVVSYTVVVKGDVDGTAVIDTIDAMLVELTAHQHKTLDGAYLAAALLDPATAPDGVTADDVGRVLELVAAQ